MAENINNDEQPIIIKKIIKKAGHGGAHGGAWKVAYADFVTAMMCLFLLLWLVNVDPSVKSAVAAEFKQPTSSGPMDGNVFIFGGAMNPGRPGKLEGGASFMQFEKQYVTQENKMEMMELILKDFKKNLEVESDEDLLESVDFNVTDKGILIEIKELNGKELFKSGSSSLTIIAMRLLDKLSQVLRNKAAPLIISGHTDAKPYQFGNYDNWSLSTDRAHAIRKRLVFNGIDEKFIRRVEGLGDTQLKLPEAPFASLNRRITVLLLQEDKIDDLLTNYVNPDDKFNFISEEKQQEAITKQAKISQENHNLHEQNKPINYINHDAKTHDSSPTAGKSHQVPSLDDLKKKLDRDNYRAKHPAQAAPAEGGH